MDYNEIDKIKLKGIDTSEEYIPAEECEVNDKAVSALKKASLKQSYDFVNAVVLAVIFLASAAVFLAVSGDTSIDEEELSISGKSFLSGEYEQKLEEKYITQLPFPDEIKAIEDRISLVYGIGNKIESKWSTEDNDIDEIHNSFDQNSDSSKADDNENENKEEVITTTQKQDDSKAETTTTKKKAETKPPETTVALARPYDTTTTTTTTAETTTTNNTSPTATTTLPADGGI